MHSVGRWDLCWAVRWVNSRADSSGERWAVRLGRELVGLSVERTAMPMAAERAVSRGHSMVAELVQRMAARRAGQRAARRAGRWARCWDGLQAVGTVAPTVWRKAGRKVWKTAGQWVAKKAEWTAGLSAEKMAAHWAKTLVATKVARMEAMSGQRRVGRSAGYWAEWRAGQKAA